MVSVKVIDGPFSCAHNVRMVGRPKIPKRAQKGEHVNIRLTTEQKAELATAAQRAGIGLSSWMLLVALREARKEVGRG
jgi:hypothetical protein